MILRRLKYSNGLFVLGIVMLLSGCMRNKEDDEKEKWNVTLNKEDKKPYGTYLAYQSLQYYFPGVKVEPLASAFRYDNMDNNMKYNYYGTSLMVLVGLDFFVTDKEWNQLLNFADNGNEIVIFCSRLDKKIEETLKCHKKLGNYEAYPSYYFGIGKDINENVLSLTGEPDRTYGYKGRSLYGYFAFDTVETEADDDEESVDSESVNAITQTQQISSPSTLGYVASYPDFIRYKVGSGHITLHAAPLALSNYFLLQDGNEDYLTGLWHTLPGNIANIYWNEYYVRSESESDYGTLWKYSSIKLALLLGIAALLLYVLFEGKRRQRIIPILPPVRNDSVSFVETVGRLYYNKGNHTNLAEKMIQQFLEWVRAHYFLNTNLLNDEFIRQLVMKSGQPEHKVRQLAEMIHEIRLNHGNIDDAYLYQLYNTIQEFYKNRTN